MSFSRQPVIYRVKRGLQVGLAIACVCSLWSVIAYSLKSPVQIDAMRITLRRAVIAYLIGGLFGGVFVGVAVSLMRWALGAFLLGFVANLPTTLIMASFIASDLPLFGRIALGLLAACIGGTLALYIRSDPWP